MKPVFVGDTRPYYKALSKSRSKKKRLYVNQIQRALRHANEQDAKKAFAAKKAITV
jgi:hypothetical protein